MKYEKKHSFTLSTSAEVNPATDAKKVMGKTYLVQVFAVGGFKILENAPIDVIQKVKMMTKIMRLYVYLRKKR